MRGLNHLGKAEYRFVFVTKPGKKLAFGSLDSTQGHLIPRIMLQEQGIPLSSLAKYTYTGSHHNCAEAVISGKYDICGMQDELAESLQQRGLLKIIKSSECFSFSGIASNKMVPKAVRRAVKKALLDFDPQGGDKHILFHWQKTEMQKGFTESHNADYQQLRDGSIGFGFLHPVDEHEGT